MKREIKFQVINEDGKPIGCESWSIEFGWTHICFNDRPIEGGGYPIHAGTMSESINNLRRRQFTGLLDKAGKEIWEGDVFQYTKHPKYLLESFVSNIIFIDEWCCFGYTVGSYLIGTREVPFSEHDELQTDFLNHIEVIGNIYESPLSPPTV